MLPTMHPIKKPLKGSPLMFKNVAEFNKWKEDEGHQDGFQFQQLTSTFHNQGITYYYACHCYRLEPRKQGKKLAY